MPTLIPVNLSRACIDIAELPAEFHTSLREYAHGVLRNQELDAHNGRWLVPVSFVDVADDDTPEELVRSMARGDIGFDAYPYDGIFWDILGVTPAAYASFVLAVRHLRTVLAPDVIEADALHLLV